MLTALYVIGFFLMEIGLGTVLIFGMDAVRRIR